MYIQIAVIELELMHGTCTCPFYERDYPHKDEVLKIIIYKFTNFFSEIKFNQVWFCFDRPEPVWLTSNMRQIGRNSTKSDCCWYEVSLSAEIYLLIWGDFLELILRYVYPHVKIMLIILFQYASPSSNMFTDL